MNRFLKVLGKTLITTAAIFFLVTLICSVPMAKDMDLPLWGNILIILCMLLMYFGLFCLGWLIYKAGCRGKKEREPKPRKAAAPSVTKTPTAAVSLAAQTTRPAPFAVPAPQNVSGQGGAAQTSSSVADPMPRRSPLPDDLRLELYRDDFARKEASLRDGEVVPERLELILHEDKPLVQLSTVQLGELFSGSMFRENQERKELPDAIRSKPGSQSLFAWIEEAFPCMQKPGWNVFVDEDRLNDFLGRIYRQAAYPRYRSVYLSEPPFPSLDTLGPDGLRDESGFRHWLLLRSGAERDEALSDAEEIARFGKTVLLTTDGDFLHAVSNEKREALEKAGVMVALPLDGEGLLDLATGKEYRLDYEEWPGSADDAATYGRWWLKQEEKKI